MPDLYHTHMIDRRSYTNMLDYPLDDCGVFWGDLAHTLCCVRSQMPKGRMCKNEVNAVMPNGSNVSKFTTFTKIHYIHNFWGASSLLPAFRCVRKRSDVWQQS